MFDPFYMGDYNSDNVYPQVWKVEKEEESPMNKDIKPDPTQNVNVASEPIDRKPTDLTFILSDLECHGHDVHNHNEQPKFHDNENELESQEEDILEEIVCKVESRCAVKKETAENSGQKVEADNGGEPGPLKVKRKRRHRKMDRYAFYTDGKTCWNPPCSVFDSNFHPIPKMEPPRPRFRFYHQHLLKKFVKESLVRNAYEKLFTEFEQRCLDAGMDMEEIETFRQANYDNRVIANAWFGSQRLKAKTSSEKEAWALKQPILAKIILDLVAGMKKISDENFDNHLKDPNAKIDWLFVSAKMRTCAKRCISPAACQRLWKNLLMPTLSFSGWTQQDISKLKAITTRPGKRNFVNVAQEMGGRFTPYMCFKIYAMYIKPFTIDKKVKNEDKVILSVWNREEVQADFKDAMEMYHGSLRWTALWLSHAYGVEFTEEFLEQVTERNKFRIGPFLLMEDGLVIVTDEIIRFHNSLVTLGELLPWRPEQVWNSRVNAIRFPHHATSGGEHFWSDEEDQHLLALVKKHKTNWSKLTSFFQHPKRNRKQLQARYFRLQHNLQRQSLQEYHSERRLKTNTPYYNMRKSLFLLEQVDTFIAEFGDVDSGSVIIDKPPPPSFVRSLFQDFYANYEHRPISFKRTSKKHDKTFPQENEIRSLLLKIPRFYVRRAIDKMRGFLTEIGISCTLEA